MSKKSRSAANATRRYTAVKRVTIFVNSKLVGALLTSCNATQKNFMLGVQENRVGTHLGQGHELPSHGQAAIRNNAGRARQHRLSFRAVS